MGEETFTLKARVLLETAQEEISKVQAQVGKVLSPWASAFGKIGTGIATAKPETAKAGMAEMGGLLMGGLTKLVLPLLAIESLMRSSGVMLKGVSGILTLVMLLIRPIADAIGGIILTVFRLLMPFVKMLMALWAPHQKAILEAVKNLQTAGAGPATQLAGMLAATSIELGKFFSQVFAAVIGGISESILSGIKTLGDGILQMFGISVGNPVRDWFDSTMQKMIDGVRNVTTSVIDMFTPGLKASQKELVRVALTTNDYSKAIGALLTSIQSARKDGIDPLAVAIMDVSSSSALAAGDTGLGGLNAALLPVGPNAQGAASGLQTLGAAITNMLRILSQPLPNVASAGGGMSVGMSYGGGSYTGPYGSKVTEVARVIPTLQVNR